MINEKEQEDLEYARKIYRDMLEKGVSAVDLMTGLLEDSESPRAGEVTANLIKTTAEIADRLIALHKTNKELKTISSGKELSAPTTVNNANFIVGTTTDIQKLLHEISNEKIIQNIEIVDNSLIKE
jgi:hypothetical protein